MKNTIHRILAAALSGAFVMAGTVPVSAEYKVQSTVTRGRTGTLVLDYKDDTEGKRPVVGAQFTLYKIGRLVMPVTGGTVADDTVVINPDGTTSVEDNQNAEADSDTSDQTNNTANNIDLKHNALLEGQYNEPDTADQLDKKGKPETKSKSEKTSTKNENKTFSIADHLITPVMAEETENSEDHKGKIPDPDYEYVKGKKTATAGQAKATENPSEDNSVGVVPDSAVGNGKKAAVHTYWYSLIPGIKTDKSLNPVKIEKKVKDAYKAGVAGGRTYKLYTDGSGIARKKNIQQGIYLAVETKPAREHFASIPFIVSMPQMIYKNDGKKQSWCFSIKAYPKSLPGGDLKIGKRVTGNDGQRNKTWHFNVSLDLSKANSTKGTTSAERYTDRFASGEAPNGYHTAKSPIKSKKYGRTYDRAKKVYRYTTSDGRKGKIGTKGTITLRSGQTATIRCIPIGTAYKVTEREANQNRYKTRVKNDEGRIRQHVVQKVSFINNRVKPIHHRRPGRPVRRVKTGDATKMAIYIAIAAAAVSAAILIWRKRKEE